MTNGLVIRRSARIRVHPRPIKFSSYSEDPSNELQNLSTSSLLRSELRKSPTMDMSDETIARVSSSSVTFKVAGAIAGIMREKGRVIVQAIGTSACY